MFIIFELMKARTVYLFVCVWFFVSSVANGQNGFTRQQNIPVQVGNSFLKLPWAGGLSFPHFSEFDFNQDGIKDLFVFDRSNQRIIPFINMGTANQVDYVFAPQYTHFFPPANMWAFTYDYNCDGREDFFTLSDTYDGIKVYRNNTTGPTSFQFTLVSPKLISQYPTVTANIPASYVQYPAFVDIDNDGDMDILAWNGAEQGIIEYDKNISVESGYGCDSLKFQYQTSCWGNISIPEQGCTHTGISCGQMVPPADDNLTDRSGNLRKEIPCMSVMDIDNDGDKDLLIGGLGETNLQMARNGGTPSAAIIDYVDCLWPVYDTNVEISSFASAANIDVDNDGKKDVIVAPAYQNDFDGVWYYRDTSSSSLPAFHFQYNGFLQREMIDVGTGSYPALFDYDNDGLMDMVIGNYSYYQSSGGFRSGLSLYRNIGTSTAPAFQLITKDYAGLFSANFCVGYGNDVHPTFGDIDGDGDLDMIVGDYCGRLQLFLNDGSNNSSNFGTQGIPSVMNYQGIDIGSNAAPQLIDLDRDGKLDLIIGKRNGFISYYHNNGTTTNALFTFVTDSLGHVDASNLNTGFSCPFVYEDGGNYRLLVGNEKGYVFRFGNIDGNLNGTFSVIDTLIRNEEGGRVSIGMGDINGDGLPDLLIGNYAGGVSLWYQDNPLSVNPDSGIKAGAGMEVFPNPAHLQTEIQCSNLNRENKTELDIFDMTGQKVFSLPCSAPSLTLDVSSLNAGIYFLNLQDGKHSVVQKLMVY